MKRRSFVKASLLTGTASTILPKMVMAESENKGPLREFYELRVYSFSNATQQTIVEDYLKNALIPALNRIGNKNIGVFTELEKGKQPRLFVLIPHSSMDGFVTQENKLAKDATYQQQAFAYLNAPLAMPVYDRIESSLLQAFTGMPKIELPGTSTRIFELRQYQSPTEGAGKKKIEMFNQGGEIGIFKRLGFKPVFYSETLIGAERPNLTYMVTFDNMAAHDSLWKAFGSDPEWVKLKSMPDYPDALVSKITSTMLTPAAYSQI
ncbi:NIPSNAP family protein [Mucilaginibacter sp.]